MRDGCRAVMQAAPPPAAWVLRALDACAERLANSPAVGAVGTNAGQPAADESTRQALLCAVGVLVRAPAPSKGVEGDDGSAAAQTPRQYWESVHGHLGAVDDEPAAAPASAEQDGQASRHE